jgi:hypothetical protein
MLGIVSSGGLHESLVQTTDSIHEVHSSAISTVRIINLGCIPVESIAFEMRAQEVDTGDV